MSKTYLVIRYDVTHLTDDEIDAIERGAGKATIVVERAVEFTASVETRNPYGAIESVAR